MVRVLAEFARRAAGVPHCALLAAALACATAGAGCTSCGTPRGGATDAGGGGTTDGGPGLDSGGGAPDSGGTANTSDAGGGSSTDGAPIGTDAAPGATDADGDNISDADEGAPATDTDSDGLPDYTDADSDNDGIPDALEAGDADDATPPVDTDGDGAPDFRDSDSDGDGIPDLFEGTDDDDGDGAPNFQDTDADGDGIPDAVETASDSDGDGTPNYLDIDSDDDFILDAVEGAGDPDGDGAPNYLDTDSDGDGVLDITERSNPTCGCSDTDADGVADFLDTDSDGDGIPDATENAPPGGFGLDPDADGISNYWDLDSDSDGLYDSDESAGCPSAYDDDSDTDGFSDLAEVAVGTDPCSAASVIPDFYFVLPFGTMDASLFMFSTDLSQIDLHINVDTTGSMGGEINNIQSGLSATIIPGVTAAVADAEFGVSEYEDFPYNQCNSMPSNTWCNFGTGSPPADIFGWEDSDIMISEGWTCGGNPTTHDRPFALLSPIGGDVVGGVNNLDLPLGCGLDTPEAGWEALYQIATGVGWGAFTDSNGTVYSPLVPAFVPGGGAGGTIGGVGFRDGSLPIVLHITDAVNHTPAEYASAFSGAPSVSTATTALTGIAARVITVNSWATGAGTDPQSELATLANATGASIPPCAWSFNPDGSAATRPAGCTGAQCCTGVGGVGVGTTGGTCPLSFRISDTGSGLSTLIVNSINLLVNFSTVDVTLDVYEDPALPGGLCMVKDIAPVSATNPFPGCAMSATPFNPSTTVPGDEGFNNVTPGMVLTFNVVVNNDCVPQDMTARAFGAIMDIVADGVTVLDSQTITMIVPPLPPAGQ
ncbi:MAG TPA: hypothetical protein VG389_29005 [Myxococcota bacterium]|nr:hypothetical protein [Myxococcota bacterium]